MSDVSDRFYIRMVRWEPTPAELKDLPSGKRRLFYALRDALDSGERIDLNKIRKRTLASRKHTWEHLASLNRRGWLTVHGYECTYADTGEPAEDGGARFIQEQLDAVGADD